MAFVVTGACIACKYTDCVDVCPMDCFVEGPNMLVIDPAGCISCSICVPECPLDAIVDEHDLSPDQQHYAALNARLARQPGWHSITRSHPPLPEHERWRERRDKLDLLQE